MKTILLSLLIVLTISCSKSNQSAVPEAAAKPVVKIIAPTASEYYKTDDPLCFKGNVLAGKQLVIVRLKLFKESDTVTPCLQFDYYTNEKYFELDKKIIVPSYLEGSCRIEFEAVDVLGQTSKAVIGFSSN